MTDQPGGFWKTIGVLGVMLGVGVVGAHALDFHSHTCDKCGRRWRHLGAFNIGDHAAHTCPGCGEIQWWKDFAKDGAFRTTGTRLK